MILRLNFLRLDANINFLGDGSDRVPLNSSGYDYRGGFTRTNVRAAYVATPPAHYLVTTKPNTYGAFASDILNLTERLSVLADVRVDRADTKGGIPYSLVDTYQ